MSRKVNSSLESKLKTSRSKLKTDVEDKNANKEEVEKVCKGVEAQKIIKAFENNVNVMKIKPGNADDDREKDAFKMMMVGSKLKWGEIKSYSPHRKKVKRMTDIHSNSPGSPCMLMR